MHEPLLLSINEMREVSGYKVRPGQIKWFQKNGFSYTIARDGHPRILREHFKEVMGLKNHRRRSREPNFDAIRD